MNNESGYESILFFSVRIGEIMLKSGAETYRVEDTIMRILDAHHFEYVDTFVTPTVIMATIKDKNYPSCSTLRRIKNRSTRLDKIESINQLSRDYVSGQLSFEEASSQLTSIENSLPYSPLLIRVATGLSSGFFSLMFNAGLVEFAIATCIGFVVATLQQSLKMKEIVNYFILFMSSILIGSIITGLLLLFPDTLNSEALIIGCIMPLVPGLAFTNAIRDTIGDELLSGMSRGVEALFIAVAIAAGVVLPLSLGIHLGGLIL